MKKMAVLRMGIKYLLLAILLGGITGNLLCIIEAVSGKSWMPDFGILLLLFSSLLTCLIYLLFMRGKKTVYALACIPSTACVMIKMEDFWGQVFHLPEESMNFYSLGTAVLYYEVLFLSVGMVLLTLLIRWILIRCEKLLDFEETEEGYYTRLNGLSFACAGKTWDYKKSVRALADAYVQEKEKEIAAYIISQEDYIPAYGEMTEEEMLETIEDMPFYPHIFLYAESRGKIVFRDETDVIELSFEGIFENLHDISIRKL